jgi:hypothetical protein
MPPHASGAPTSRSAAAAASLELPLPPVPPPPERPAPPAVPGLPAPPDVTLVPPAAVLPLLPVVAPPAPPETPAPDEPPVVAEPPVRVSALAASERADSSSSAPSAHATNQAAIAPTSEARRAVNFQRVRLMTRAPARTSGWRSNRMRHRSFRRAPQWRPTCVRRPRDPAPRLRNIALPPRHRANPTARPNRGESATPRWRHGRVVRRAARKQGRSKARPRGDAEPDPCRELRERFAIHLGCGCGSISMFILIHTCT